ncbi:MAG TPA: rhodanese-like domain-containing protein [Vicinamibacterales bacterium]|nr:rhodanese-like domain-containing protein [Vicinamibacterales bacterium]
MHRTLWLLVALLTPLTAAAAQTKFPVDPKTGRAIGARELAPAALAQKENTGAKLVVIDVRDPAEFKKDTIKGAINIPLNKLAGRLKDFSKDTTLVFT